MERRAARRPRPAARQDGGAAGRSGTGRPSPPQDAGEDEPLPALACRAAGHREEHGQPVTRDALRARPSVPDRAASELPRQLLADDGRPAGGQDVLMWIWRTPVGGEASGVGPASGTLPGC
jgi:hypothetical protein